MYEGLNERGATLRVGGPEIEGEHFSPGELLKLALISCAGLSADRVAARRLGEDFALTVWAHGKSDHDTNRYSRIEEELLLDLVGARARRARRSCSASWTKAIERGCTVARTIEDGRRAADRPSTARPSEPPSVAAVGLPAQLGAGLLDGVARCDPRREDARRRPRSARGDRDAPGARHPHALAWDRTAERVLDPALRGAGDDDRQHEQEHHEPGAWLGRPVRYGVNMMIGQCQR